MKKVFFLLSILAVTFSAVAQNTIPRFQESAQKRQTINKLNAYTTVTDTTGSDTAYLAPNAAKTIVKLSVKDSIAVKFSKVTNSYVGDEVLIIATNASGASHKIKILSTNTEPSSSGGTVTLASTLGAVIRYVFNGAKWVEASRAVQ